jgi:hypothetical protein
MKNGVYNPWEREWVSLHYIPRKKAMEERRVLLGMTGVRMMGISGAFPRGVGNGIRYDIYPPMFMAASKAQYEFWKRLKFVHILIIFCRLELRFRPSI